MSDSVYLSNSFETHLHPILQPPAFNHRPIVINVNSFAEDSIADFRDYMQEASDSGQPRVQIYIDSFGGDVYALIGMMEIIKNSPIPVDTICTTKAMSCGACLFVMGESRYISPEATLMFHDFQQSISDNTPVTHIAEHAREGQDMREKVMTLIDDKRGKKEGTLEKKLKEHGSWFLNANEAKKENFCDYIGPAPKMVVEVRCDITFREQ